MIETVGEAEGRDVQIYLIGEKKTKMCKWFYATDKRRYHVLTSGTCVRKLMPNATLQVKTKNNEHKCY